MQFPCQNPTACFLLMQYPCQSPTRPADVVMLIWVPCKNHANFRYAICICNYHANTHWHTSCTVQKPCQQNMAYKMQVQYPCQRDTQRTKPNDGRKNRAKVSLYSSGILNAKCNIVPTPNPYYLMQFLCHSINTILFHPLASFLHHAISIPYPVSNDCLLYTSPSPRD